jgi:hypothetical protein
MNKGESVVLVQRKRETEWIIADDQKRVIERLLDIATRAEQQSNIVIPQIQQLKLEIERAIAAGAEGDDLDLFVAMDPFDWMIPGHLRHAAERMENYSETRNLVDQEWVDLVEKVVERHEEQKMQFLSELDKMVSAIQAHHSFVLEDTEVDEAKKRYALLLIEMFLLENYQNPKLYEWVSNICGGFEVVLNLSGEKKPKFFSLERVMKIMQDPDRGDEAMELFKTIVQRNSLASIRFFEMYLLEKRNSFPLSQLKTIFMHAIHSSSAPLEASLLCSWILKRLGSIYVSENEDYEQASQEAGKIAIAVMDALHSDQVAYLFLFSKRQLEEERIFDLAIHSGNIEFLSSPRVARIVDAVWSDPNFMNRKGMVGDLSPIVYLREKFSLNALFRISHLPYWKFYTQMFSDAIYLALFTLMVTSQNFFSVEAIESPRDFERLELLVYLLSFGYWVHAVKSVYYDRSNYIKNIWNILENAINIILFMIILLRSINVYFYNFSDISLAILFLYVFEILLLWIKVLHLFVCLPSIGPIIQVIKKLVSDIIVFLVFAVVLVVGFSSAFYSILKYEEIDGFSDFGRSLITLSQSFFGNYDILQFDQLRENNLHVHRLVIFLSTSYQLFSNIILVNLLIALMSNTFAIIQDRANKEFLYLKSQVTQEFEGRDSTLPAPFNLFVYLLLIALSPIFGIISIYKKGLNSIFVFKPKAEYWTCNFCLKRNPIEDSTTNDLMNYLDSRDPTKLNVLKDLIDCEQPICKFCFRFRQKVSKSGIRAEVVSQSLVYLVLFSFLLIVSGTLLVFILSLFTAYFTAAILLGIPSGIVLFVYLWLFRKHIAQEFQESFAKKFQKKIIDVKKDFKDLQDFSLRQLPLLNLSSSLTKKQLNFGEKDPNIIAARLKWMQSAVNLKDSDSNSIEKVAEMVQELLNLARVEEKGEFCSKSKQKIHESLNLIK